ncbi:ABC transporter ATP-binding protein [Streptococcus pneumoniae]|nr:ABC transporter ATP-binding protein [Streptococcus pneumoniae]
MFWNLIRYEFKNVNKWYLALYAAVLVLSVLIGMQAHYYNYVSFKDSQPVLLFFLALVFGGLMITLGISTIFLIIKRFKGSVYDRQGYLTLTLPVSEHHIITAKLVGAFIWSILSSTVLALSAFIIVTITVPEWISNSELIPLVGTFLPQLSLMGVSFLLNTISEILCIYLAISIGQLFNEYRTALAVVAYIGIKIIIGFIEVFFNTSTNFYVNSLAGFNDNFYMGASISIVEELIFIAIFYLGTYYILRNKVNLQ